MQPRPVTLHLAARMLRNGLLMPRKGQQNGENQVNTQNHKRVLLAKANELRSGQLLRDHIAIERNAELMDEIQRASDREIAMASMTRDWHTAILVSEALERISTGEYGVCAECDEPISERRLNAIPWAKFCIRCQEKADSKQNVYEMAEAA